jgi:hypothetical protein
MSAFASDHDDVLMFEQDPVPGADDERLGGGCGDINFITLRARPNARGGDRRRTGAIVCRAMDVTSGPP